MICVGHEGESGNVPRPDRWNDSFSDYPCVMFLSKMIKKENAETSASETFGMYHGLLK